MSTDKRKASNDCNSLEQWAAASIWSRVWFEITGRGSRPLFSEGMEIVILELEGCPKAIKLNIDKPSFWNPTCRELISKEIEVWLIENKLAPWPKGKPPK